MKIILLMIISLWMAPLYAATFIGSPEEAKKQAKSSQSDCIIMIYGGDWNRQGKVFQEKCWNENILKTGIDSSTIVSTLCSPQTTDSEQNKQANEQKKNVGVSYSSLPALSFLDKNGFEYCSLSGDKLPRNATTLMARIRQIQALRQKRDDLLEKSKSMSGVNQAKLLGSAGEINGLNRPPSILNDLKKCDPEDQSGYIKRFTFDVWSLHQYMKSSKEEALAALDKELTAKGLTADQKQQIYGVRGMILLRNKASADELRDNFKKMNALNPQSINGKAAVQAALIYAK
ncbi:MAG: hypothetical protein RR506_04785 [Akkermansia sp.]